MKLLINTSNLYFGGGLQVALSFINELKDINLKNEYHIFTSLAVDKQLKKNDFLSNFTFYLIEKSPSSLLTRKNITSKLNNLEHAIQPDIVFSVFGPSYWKPKAKHISGFADGWVYNPKSVAYSKLSFIKQWKMKLHAQYKKYYLKKYTDYFVIETKDAKEKLSKILQIKKEKIFVVGNTYSKIFDNNDYISNNHESYVKLPKKEEDEFRFMYIAHNHPAKNLAIINKILPFLKKEKIKFILTIDIMSYNSMFPDNPPEVINIGPIAQNSCPSIYHQCDALFAPTLLETFSAAYPEAMKMRKPILTSNYSFATDICQDAALYFDPLDPKDITEKIKLIIKDKALREKLIDKGSKRVVQFETANSRAKSYLAICEEIINNGEIINV